MAGEEKAVAEEEAHKQQAEPRFKPKKGSVNPVRRRPVKRMMFEGMACIFFCCPGAGFSGNGSDGGASRGDGLAVDPKPVSDG